MLFGPKTAYSPLQNPPVRQVIALAVEDFQHPDIGVIARLPGDIGLGLGLGHRHRAERLEPGEAAFRRRGLGQQTYRAIRPDQLHDHHPGIVVAVTQNHGRPPRHIAKPHLCPHPKARLYPCIHIVPNPCALLAAA